MIYNQDVKVLAIHAHASNLIHLLDKKPLVSFGHWYHMVLTKSSAMHEARRLQNNTSLQCLMLHERSQKQNITFRLDFEELEYEILV